MYSDKHYLLPGRVSPFGYLRIKARCQLPEAFRRLPRLSSPLTAKASTNCAYSLDHIISNSLALVFALYPLQFLKNLRPFSLKKTFSSVTHIMVEPVGIEPTTSCVQGRRSPS